jgi:ABC-type sugar transport system ATPase subunit
MTLGDRIVIMKDGFIQQIGTPQEVFDHPGQPLRGRLHRHAADELLRRRADVSELMGSELHLHVNSNGKDVVIVVPTADIDLDTVHGGHKSIQYTFQPRLMHFFDKDTEKNLF